MCQQKLGHKEAQSAFQKVIDNYPAQTEAVRLAREQLSLLAKAQDVINKKNHGPTIRQVWSGSEADTYGAPSPDGRYLSFVDWSISELAVRDLETGEIRQITDRGSGPYQYAMSSIWSPDGKQLAYHWCERDGHPVELFVTRLDGSKPRVLYSVEDYDEWLEPYDWSPDGKQILAEIPGKKLALISVEDGSVRVLKTLGRYFLRAKFSPDGRYIIYEVEQNPDSSDRDIRVMSVEGADDRPLVSHPADDSILGWTPDGKFVLFLSDRTGSPCFWLLPVKDGRAAGNPQMIKTASRRIVPLGFSRDGRFFYGENKAASDIYAVNLNPATGKVLGSPERIIDQYEGFNFHPSFSPDGKYLAYCSRRGGNLYTTNSGNVLCIHSIDNGEEKEYAKELRESGIGYVSILRWAPDGKSIAFGGIAKPAGGYGGIYVINLQTGTVTEVAYTNDNVKIGPQFGWSSDGKGILFSRFDKKKSLWHMVKRNLETGNERILYKFPGQRNPLLMVSPDFQQLLIGDNVQNALLIMKASEGEPRILHKFTEKAAGGWVEWAADGKHILYTRKDKAAGWQLWRFSVDGGEPELLGSVASDYRGDLSARPDGKQVTFSAGPRSGAEIWVMDNFLPE
jgi:Tol biopolymer transport system component